MTERDLDVVVVGNVGVDTNVYFHSGDIDFSVESNYTENLDSVGQAGGYASRGFAQLGYRTAFLGYVGDDYNGRYVRDVLRADGIDVSALFVDPAGTGRSINFMYKDGRRKNFYDGKGHMHLEPDMDVCRLVLSRAKLAHFSIPNWARLLLPLASELDLMISCDIQDIVSMNDPYREDFINYAHILFLSGVNHPDPSALVDKLIQQNRDQIILVGMGSSGCALCTKEGLEFYPPVETHDPVIDTNGAGDALAVGFLSSFVFGGCSLEDSVLRGQIAARYTCSIKASSEHLINPATLDRLYNAQK